MKIIKSCLTISAISFGLIACSSQVQETSGNTPKNVEKLEQKSIKETVWNQLSKMDKDRIAGTWEGAEIHKIVLSEEMLVFKLNGKKHPYLGMEVYALDFPTTESPLSNMIVYADTQTFKYVGHRITE